MIVPGALVAVPHPLKAAGVIDAVEIDVAAAALEDPFLSSALEFFVG
jgi:hypothetical protein